MTVGAHDRAAKPDSVQAAAPLVIAGVGASAGGLEAFTQLLRHLPTDTGLAFVLVQHLDPRHESALTSLLSRATAMPVEEVRNDLRVERDRVYVIPPNANMGIREGVLKLEPLQKRRGVNRAIDFFFQSLAQDLQERAIGVILSGTASDGALGMEAIKAEGGITFAQDDSAAYDSMPRSAIAAGCVDFILKPEDIAKELAHIASHPLVAGQPFSTAKDERARATSHADETALQSGGHGALPTEAKQARGESEAVCGRPGDNDFKKILLLLRNHSGADFSLYKPTTIQRRITRRMVLNGNRTLEDYADFLRGNTKELDALYSDVLVNVTSFFRDPEAFDVVKRQVFSKFVPNSKGEPFRAWVPGCSTGQEAYSIAMAFTEARDETAGPYKLQIFATDLNEALLDKARQGLYAKSLMQDVSPERLRRFFVEEEGGYRVNKSLREMVVFAKQNLITDPPFSRLNLVSCRNLLIYLEPELQQKLIPMFKYALKPDGFLFLGASESIGGYAELFEPLDKKHKIYSRKGSRTPTLYPQSKKERGEMEPHPHLHGPHVETPLLVEGQEARNRLHAELTSLREADRVTVSKYSPPGVLVNEDLQIVQFRGPTGAYLEPPTGKASFDVLKMARSGLMLPLRAVIAEAKKNSDTVRRENIRFERDGETQAVSVEVIPLKNLRERHFLILFDEAGKRKVEGPSSQAAGAERVVQRASQGEDSRRIADLERELAETRDYLQFIQEQNEAGNEGLQASNEEIQSANEELQSINEELETSKEELESANEELITVNEEMAGRNAELSRLNNDLINFQVASHLAVVVVARDLTIRRFSAQAEQPFNLFAADVGRPLGTLRHNLDLPDLSALVEGVVASVRESEREVRDKAGCWHSLRVRPYLTLDNKVDGAVLVLVDIDALKRTQEDITEARELAEAVLATVPDPLVILNGNLSIRSANTAFYRVFKLSPAEAEGHSIFEIDHGAWENPTLRRLIVDVIPGSSVFNDFELTHDFERIGLRSMLVNGRVLRQIDGKPKLVLLGMRDVTDRRASDRRRDEFLAILAHELRNPLAPIRNALPLLGKPETDREQTTKLVGMIERQTDQLVRLVDELLTASRITGNKIELKKARIDLASVLHDAIELSRPAIEIGRHDLRVTMPKESVTLDADPMRLRQVFSNLLNNAAKYTDPGGTIWIEAARRGTEAVISVRDTGIGIAPEMQPHIFELFMQVDRTKVRAQGGLGIGLALARSLVSLHGGAIEVESKGLGEGATFIVRLPVARDGEYDALERPTEEGALRSMNFQRRALVVDDDHDVADSLVMLLKSLGATVFVAYSGETALSAIDEFKPDVAFLDLGMSPMDGLETARRIRERTSGRNLTLIALTGWGQEEDLRRTREAGFDHHLLKPLNLEALRKILA